MKLRIAKKIYANLFKEKQACHSTYQKVTAWKKLRRATENRTSRLVKVWENS